MLYQSNLPQISIEQFHQMFKDCIGTIIYNSI